jgi:SAM-dependent methyltransferase
MTAAEYDSNEPGLETVEECERCLVLLEACTGAIDAALSDGLGSRANVVDLACGVGEPGLSLLRVHGDWQLTGVDLSGELVTAAEQHAREQDLTGRATFVTGSIDELPFGNAVADAVVSRMGALLLGDPAATAREMARILRPGGRFAVAVWANAEDHPLLALSYRALTAHVPAESLPDLFTWFRQMAAPGVREGWLREAGMSEVTVDTFDWVVRYPDFEAGWDLSRGIWSGTVSGLDARTLDLVRSTLRELLQPYEAPFGGGYVIPATCQLIRGVR